MLECPHSQDWKQVFDYTHHAMDLSLTPYLLRHISYNMGRFVTAIFYLFMRISVLVSTLNPFQPFLGGSINMNVCPFQGTFSTVALHLAHQPLIYFFALCDCLNQCLNVTVFSSGVSKGDCS